MSDSSRGNTLIVVEGNHEKNELFSLIARCYPELRIDPDNVWIYGTNIYRFYELIVKEYTKKWDEVDIDIPYLISSHNKMDTRWKTEFINIYLFFDYERQDPNFDYDNLKRLQEYFSDETDCGKLYVNYPMIEAYLDFDCMDEDKYINKKIVTNYQKGSIYKNLVSKFSIVEKHILKPQKNIQQ